MSTAPFNTACWALGIACFVTIVTAIPAAWHRSATGELAQRPPLFQQRRGAEIALKEPVAPAPVAGGPVMRLATSDVNAPLGLSPQQPLAPPRVGPFENAPPLPLLSESLEIRVPDPVEPRAAAPAPVPHSPAVIQLAPKVFTPADFNKLGNGLSAADEKALRKFLADNGVTLSRVPGQHWSYHFHQTPVEIVLALLAAHADRPVLVASNVSGTYSGEFSSMDAWQVFTLVVKFNELQVGRRGEHWLILPPRAQLSAAR